MSPRVRLVVDWLVGSTLRSHLFTAGPQLLHRTSKKKLFNRQAADKGVGLSRKQNLDRTNTLYKGLNWRQVNPNFHAGKDWWQGERRGHPEITLKMPEKVSTVWARILNQNVHSYFDALERIVTDRGVTDAEIWKCDETGWNFEHSLCCVVTVCGAKSVVGKSSQRSSIQTIMAFVNGSGTSMPPLILTKGNTPKSVHVFNRCSNWDRLTLPRERVYYRRNWRTMVRLCVLWGSAVLNVKTTDIWRSFVTRDIDYFWESTRREHRIVITATALYTLFTDPR